MKKDAYYFPHFSNARNDAKLVKLRRVMGIEGYGMYFLLLEVLREQTEFKLPLSSLEDLAYEWHISKEKLLAVVTNFDLFEIIDEVFISTKLITYLQPYIEKSERARKAANLRWNNANDYANALPEHSKCNASKVKERKVKESKVKESKVKESAKKIADIYNDVCVNLPKIQKLTNQRINTINARIKEYSLAEIGNVIQKTADSNFLNGDNQRAWKADFDWIMAPTNFIKILEDRYINKSNNNGNTELQQTAARLADKYLNEQ